MTKPPLSESAKLRYKTNHKSKQNTISASFSSGTSTQTHDRTTAVLDEFLNVHQLYKTIKPPPSESAKPKYKKNHKSKQNTISASFSSETSTQSHNETTAVLDERLNIHLKTLSESTKPKYKTSHKSKQNHIIDYGTATAPSASFSSEISTLNHNETTAVLDERLNVRQLYKMTKPPLSESAKLKRKTYYHNRKTIEKHIITATAPSASFSSGTSLQSHNESIFHVDSPLLSLYYNDFILPAANKSISNQLAHTSSNGTDIQLVETLVPTYCMLDKDDEPTFTFDRLSENGFSKRTKRDIRKGLKSKCYLEGKKCLRVKALICSKYQKVRINLVKSKKSVRSKLTPADSKEKGRFGMRLRSRKRNGINFELRNQKKVSKKIRKVVKSIKRKPTDFKCSVCSNTFTTKGSLKRHLHTHTGDKPFMCDQCPKFFPHLSHLTNHQRIHTGEKPYACDQCPKAFNHRSHLAVHIRSHTGVRPYKCQDCPKTFAKSSHLVSHARVHTGVQPYQCEICSQRFTQTSSLKEHKRKHTDERAFTCDICSKGFFSLTQLNRHQRTKTCAIIKAFKCDICLKGATTADALRRHMRRFHK